MNLFALRLFVAVAKLGSFAAAARKHELDPSSVSRTIAALEDDLRVRLFRRSTRKLALTEAGERYLFRVEPLLMELGSAEDEARSLSHRPSGTLRITASVAFGQVCLLPLLKTFREQYPAIKLDINLNDANIDLLTADVDLACRLTPGFDSDLVGVKLFDTQYYVCASPKYLDYAESINTPEDLAEHPCLVFGLPQYRSRWLFRDTRQKITEVKIRSDISISSALALRACAREAMGPVLLADWLVRQDLKEGLLVDLFPDYQVTATDYETAAWLLYPSRLYLPSKTRVMIDFLKSRLRPNSN